MGVGMSHSSLIATGDPEVWLAHEAIDRENPYLRDKQGRQVTFGELELPNGRPYEAQAHLDHIGKQVTHVLGVHEELDLGPPSRGDEPPRLYHRANRRRDSIRRAF